MKLLKLLSIQIALILSIGLISTNLYAQEVNLEDCSSCHDKGKGRLYFSPFNLLNPGVASFQLTYGKSITSNAEIQVNAAAMIADYSPIRLRKDHLWSKYITTGGYKLGLELQQKIVSFRKGHIYGSGEYFWQRTNHADLRAENNYSKEYVRNTTRFVQQRIKGASIKFGWKQYVNKKFFFDAYLGGSLSTREEHWKNTEYGTSYVQTKNFFGRQMRGNIIPWNIKFGFDL